MGKCSHQTAQNSYQINDYSGLGAFILAYLSARFLPPSQLIARALFTGRSWFPGSFVFPYDSAEEPPPPLWYAGCF